MTQKEYRAAIDAVRLSEDFQERTVRRLEQQVRKEPPAMKKTRTLLFAACLAAVLGLGVPLIGPPSVPLGKLLPLMAGSMVVALSFCSLFTLVAVNCSRKAVSVVVCMLGVIFMMSLTTYLSARLDQPEFRDTLPLVVNGQIVTGAEPNPLYLRGAVREVYQVLHDLLPYGQAMQYMTFSATHPERLPLYSLAVAALSTGAGVLLFRRKDLK